MEIGSAFGSAAKTPEKSNQRSHDKDRRYPAPGRLQQNIEHRSAAARVFIVGRRRCAEFVNPARKQPSLATNNTPIDAAKLQNKR